MDLILCYLKAVKQQSRLKVGTVELILLRISSNKKAHSRTDGQANLA